MKTFFTVLTALLSVFLIKAQDASNLAVEKQFPDNAKALEIYQAAVDRQANPGTRASKITWLGNRPANNWFISLEGGMAALYSENYREVDLKDNLKPTGALSIGRWLNPVLGLRLNLSGAKLSTYMVPGSMLYIGNKHTRPQGGLAGDGQTYFVSDRSAFWMNRFFNDGKAYKNGYLTDFTYGAAAVDLMVNLKNLFMPYNPNGLFNPVLYGGVGIAHTLKDGDRTAINSIMQQYGLQFSFRLSNHVDISLAPEVMFVPEVFDRMVGGDKTQDIVASVKLGLTYHFGFSKFIKAPLGVQTVVQQAQPDMSQINALNDKINDLKSRLSDCLAAKQNVAPTPVVEKPIDLTPVFFELDRFVIRPSEKPAIEAAANYMKQNPNVKLVLAGFADVKTGTPPHNMRLSRNRVNAVADMLVKQYGIDRKRLLLLWKGDTVQPKPVNEDNRVVMFFK